MNDASSRPSGTSLSPGAATSKNDDSPTNSNSKSGRPHNIGRHLLAEERAALGTELVLLRKLNSGKVPYAKVNELATRFGVTKRTVHRIGRRYEEAVEQGDLSTLQSKHRPGRPRVVDDAKLRHLQEFAVAHRYDFTWAEAAAALGNVSPVTLSRAAKAAGWRSVYNRILPLLSDTHKERRLEWASKYRRQLWDDWVDLDEKWFYTIVHRKRKVPPGVKAPASKCQSKRFIGKVMFLTAVAKPRPEFGFDGKIGIWRICEKKEAKRSSKNRPKGTIVTEDVEVTAKKFLEMLRTNVLPAIRRKMTWATSVTIQFDGPKPHVGGGNLAAFETLGKRGDIAVHFEVQPAQSPDTNVLDLAVFHHLQTAVDRQKRFREDWGVEALVEEVRSAFHRMDAGILQSAYLSKTNVLGEIIKCAGDNTFVVPHSK